MTIIHTLILLHVLHSPQKHQLACVSTWHYTFSMDTWVFSIWQAMTLYLPFYNKKKSLISFTYLGKLLKQRSPSFQTRENGVKIYGYIGIFHHVQLTFYWGYCILERKNKSQRNKCIGRSFICKIYR